jgi:peptidoglycan/xylan/chitin deacetylase (PgdA/CDA1 family)
MRKLILWSLTLLCPLALVLGWYVSPWCLLLLMLPMGLALWATMKPRCPWWGEVMCNFRSRSREALLTFDNAPDALETPIILDLLNANGSKALFFFTGVKALRHPELVQQIVAAGHGIGIHGMSYDRASAWWMPWRVKSEIETSLSVLKQILPDANVQWFRPASGCCGPWLHAALARNGLKLMTWSASDLSAGSRDFDKTVIGLRKDIDQGAIIALHHGRTDRNGESMTPDLVRELLLWLPGQGYSTGA